MTTRTFRRATAIAPRGEALEARRLLAGFSVTTTADDGPGSLRQAILDANATPGFDQLIASFPSGATIRPLSPLPAITDPVSIVASPRPVELDGSLAGTTTDGLVFSAGARDSTVSGLSVTRFGGSGIVVAAIGVQLHGLSVGTDYSGNLRAGNGTGGAPDAAGVKVVAGGLVAVGSAPGVQSTAPVVVGWNRRDGVLAAGGTASFYGAALVGNGGYGAAARGAGGRLYFDGPGYLHSGKRSTAVAGNEAGGIQLGAGSSGSLVRGATVFHNFGEGGVRIADSADNEVIDSHVGGNFGGGVTISGAGALRNRVNRSTVGPFTANGPGGPGLPGFAGLGGVRPVAGNTRWGVAVLDGASDNTVGFVRFSMLERGPANLIHGNGSPGDGRSRASGVVISGEGTTGNAVANNTITRNTDNGVEITGGASRNFVGVDNELGGANTISFNAGAGVLVASAGPAHSRYNLIGVNSIHANEAGIRLAGPGTGENSGTDPLDADAGGNDLQNHPVITSATRSGTGTRVVGTIHTKPNATVTLRFFGDWAPRSGVFDAARPQGRDYLGAVTVTTDAAGNASFDTTVEAPPAGSYVTATASIPEPGAVPVPLRQGTPSDTSEFSPGVRLTGVPPAVAQIYANGSAWRPAFRTALLADDSGSPTYGYAINLNQPPSFFQRLPWNNVDEVSVRFTEDVRVEADDLVVGGTRVGRYDVASFRYDPGTLTATWRLARRVGFDQVRLSLDSGDDGVEAADGGADLDGEPAPGYPYYNLPSGNGTPGGDFEFTFHVHPGDADRSGRVNANDMAAVRRAMGTSTTSPGSGVRRYSVFADLDGNGRVDALDWAAVRRALLTQPPA